MNYEKIKILYDKEAKKSDIPAKIGISRSNFDKIIKGEVNPTVESLEKIATYFGKRVGYFFDEPDAGELVGEVKDLQYKQEILNREIKHTKEVISLQKEIIDGYKSREKCEGKKEIG